MVQKFFPRETITVRMAYGVRFCISVGSFCCASFTRSQSHCNQIKTVCVLVSNFIVISSKTYQIRTPESRTRCYHTSITFVVAHTSWKCCSHSTTLFCQLFPHAYNHATCLEGGGWSTLAPLGAPWAPFWDLLGLVLLKNFPRPQSKLHHATCFC